MKSFLYKLLLFTAFCALGLFCWNQFTPERLHDSISWYILAFFSLSTGLVHYLLLRSAEKKPQLFVNQYMAITGFKFLVYLSFLVIIFLLDREKARPVALYFLILYLLFTVFEVSDLYRKLRK
jgi:hypothetical protein